jgi:ABC-type transport system substrate-binding protein
MMTVRSVALLVATLLIGGAGPAAAENVLRFSGKDAWAATMDPHSYSIEDNKGATYQVYEALLDVDSNLAIVPQLALSWQIIDPMHWEFKLRQGVRFHDGATFTAEDVVFSIGRAQAKTSDFKDRVDGIAAVEAIDDYTVRFTTTAPDPSLWLKLSDVGIMSRAWAEAHGVMKPADFVGAREETFASRHADGTGPFVLESFESRGGWVLVRNPDWWGKADYPNDNVDRVIHVAKRDPENVAALVKGELDLIQGVPYWALDRIRSHPELKVDYKPKLMTMFFGLDLGSAELLAINCTHRCRPPEAVGIPRRRRSSLLARLLGPAHEHQGDPAPDRRVYRAGVRQGHPTAPVPGLRRDRARRLRPGGDRHRPGPPGPRRPADHPEALHPRPGDGRPRPGPEHNRVAPTRRNVPKRQLSEMTMLDVGAPV